MSTLFFKRFSECASRTRLAHPLLDTASCRKCLIKSEFPFIARLEARRKRLGGRRSCIAARIWKTWKYFHLSWVVFSLTPSRSHSNACKVILRHFAACYRTLNSSPKRLEQISINFSQLNRFNKFFVSGSISQSCSARGEHSNAKCSTHLARQHRNVRWMLEFLCSHCYERFSEFWGTSPGDITADCQLTLALIEIGPTPHSRRRRWRERFDNPFQPPLDWLRRTSDMAASLIYGSINNYFCMNSCCSTPADPRFSILFLWTTNSCDEIEIPSGCLYQKSLTWRMMTVDLCVNSIRRHRHRKTAQTCHFHPTHFSFIYLITSSHFHRMVGRFSSKRNFLMRLLIESHNGAHQCESMWINFFTPPYDSSHSRLVCGSNNNHLHFFPANFSVVWNKCKRKEWKTGASAFVSHFTLKKNGDDVMEKSTEQTLRETASTENIIGKWTDEDLCHGKPEARLRYLIFSVILFILVVMMLPPRPRNSSDLDVFPPEHRQLA